MIGNTSRKLGLTALAASLVLAGCATASKEDALSTVNDAHTTLTNFHNDPDMTWFRNNVGKAKAILISPQVLQAGFVVGGSTGRAVVLARGPGGTWSHPAFYRVSTGSLGLQAGAQASEMVALLMTDKAMNTLMSSTFKLGGDVSVAAGPVGAGTGAPITTDMVVYTRSKGLYGGLNVNGMAITVSDDDNKAFYGRAVTPVDILVRRTVTNPGADALIKSLTTYAK